MRLERLQLTDFRNYRAAALHFQEARVILLGDNAQGKSNLLEAITFPAYGHSIRSVRDVEAIRKDAREAILRSQWRHSTGTFSIDMLLTGTGRRAVRVDGQYQRRLSDLLGRVRLVYFSSSDLAFVKGPPGERRRYLDLILFQLYPAYYGELQHYQKVLSQRNAFLRGLAKDHRRDASGLQAIWDEQLVEAAVPVIRRRWILVEQLGPPAARFQLAISGEQELLELLYRTSIPGLAAGVIPSPEDLSTALHEHLQAVAALERARGQSLVGPHREDLGILLNGQEARSFASQGQQRTIVLALKLAELETLWVEEDPPLLLLDDVLAELDAHRQNGLLCALADRVQTFLTTTHLHGFAADWLERAEIFRVEGGHLSRLSSEL